MSYSRVHDWEQIRKKNKYNSKLHRFHLIQLHAGLWEDYLRTRFRIEEIRNEANSKGEKRCKASSTQGSNKYKSWLINFIIIY